jgi:prepilin-type N-terminal cleavage/methylation domain-containing protein
MKKVKHRKGFTLVEMVVTMTLLAIFFTSVIVLLGPFTRIFYRVQELNRAQLISDTILQTIKEQLKTAIRIDEIYTDAEHGQIILFTDSDGVYRLLDTRGGTRSVNDYQGTIVAAAIEMKEGQLWLSYYHTNSPILSDSTTYSATRGVEQIMSNSFYDQNQIKLSFQPNTIEEMGLVKVQYMEVTVEIWLNERKITDDKGVIQMQYRPEIS